MKAAGYAFTKDYTYPRQKKSTLRSKRAQEEIQLLLELEPCSELDLTFAEQRAVGAGDIKI